MIFVQDNYLPTEVFKQLQDYCLNNKFEIVKVGEKEFSVLEPPKDILNYFQAEGYELIFSFIRSAHKDFDTDYRIHADNIIQGRKTKMASVLYINNDDVSPNGTAFYKHHKHGLMLPESCTEEEFDRLLEEDTNDLSKWEEMGYIRAVPNRLLMYDANYFHAKHPNKIEKGIRVVLVLFYAEK